MRSIGIRQMCRDGGVALAIAAGACSAASAAERMGGPYPEKPIRLIIPFAPGGSTDVIARVIATRLSDRLGRQVIADNRGGGGGLIGMELVARAEPDGYTLLFTSPAVSINPSLYKLPYDPATAFAPVGKVGNGPLLLAIHPGVAAASVKEFIALARNAPGKLTAVGSGAGSFTNLATELFKSMAGIDFLTVQYKGLGAGIIDVIGGQSQIVFATITISLPHIRAGRLRVLGFGGAQRSSLLPGVPTIAEAGVAGYEAATWNGILAPAGTPADVLDRLHRELVAILRADDTRKVFADQGAEVEPMPPAEFARFIARERTKWAAVTRNVKLDPQGS